MKRCKEESVGEDEGSGREGAEVHEQDHILAPEAIPNLNPTQTLTLNPLLPPIPNTNPTRTLDRNSNPDTNINRQLGAGAECGLQHRSHVFNQVPVSLVRIAASVRVRKQQVRAEAMVRVRVRVSYRVTSG